MVIIIFMIEHQTLQAFDVQSLELILDLFATEVLTACTHFGYD